MLKEYPERGIIRRVFGAFTSLRLAMRNFALAVLCLFLAMPFHRAMADTYVINDPCGEKNLGKTVMNELNDYLVACVMDSGTPKWKLMSLDVLTHGSAASCASGQVISAISDIGAVTCVTPIVSDITCSSGPITGISSTGVPICGTW
jgi:hypothetical protein